MPLYAGPSRNFNPTSGTYRSLGGGNPYGSTGITGGMYSSPDSVSGGGGGGGGSPDYSGTYGYGGYTGQMYGQTPNWGGFTPTIGRGATVPGLGSGNLWNTYSNLYGNGSGMNRSGMMGGGMGGRFGGMNRGGFGGFGGNQGMNQSGQGMGGGGLQNQNRFQNLYY